MTVARTTATNLAMSTRLCAAARGIALQAVRARPAPSRTRKNARYSAMNRLVTKSKVSRPMASACAAMTCVSCAAAAMRRACSVSKSTRPKRLNSAAIHAGSASNRPRM